MYLYPLYSGSSGNCSLVRAKDGTSILIDVGVSGAAALHALSLCDIDPHSISAILVTHEHIDHIKSVGVISRKLNIPVYANSGTWEQMERKIGKINGQNIRCFETGQDFYLNGLSILPFPIPHDTKEPVAFSICEGSKRLTITTDVGHITTKIHSVLERSDLVLIESNHDIDMVHTSSYPVSLQRRILSDNGHLSNESCGILLSQLYKCGVKRAILGHLSGETNTEKLAYETVSGILAKSGVGSDYMLKVAHRDRVSGKFEV